MNDLTQLPLFEPKTTWKPAEEFPDFSKCNFIGLDVETKDVNLRSRGPGAIRGDGFVCGITLAGDDGTKIYLPIRHPGGGNLDEGLVIRYVREQLSRKDQPKIGAHIIYDLEWLHSLNISVSGRCYDVLNAEPLLDEDRKSYNLENLAQKYLGRGKEYNDLKEAVVAYCGEKADPRSNIWRLPAKHVGLYAEMDGLLPIHVFMKQKKLLEQDGLWDIFSLETDLVPLLLEMRMRGVRVNISRAEETVKNLNERQSKIQGELNRLTGLEVNVWASDSISKAFDKFNLSYPRTLKTAQPSFDQDFLEDHPSEIAKMVLRIRKLDRLSGTFIRGSIIESSVNGRVHCQFHQLRGLNDGTVSGRFSSSNPNLQQVPARDQELSKLVRQLFIPEDDCDWDCDDYSQIEPRLQVHYAALQGKIGAREAAEKYRTDPKTDFHQMTAELTGLQRKPAKTIHLGLSYGMGIVALAENLGVTENEAYNLKMQYNQYMPFLQGISDDVNRAADRRGFIKTLLGRKARFDWWEPAGRDRRGRPYRTREEALERYGPPVRRADTRKAFNRLIQGSAADIMKKAMVDIWKSGICAEIGVPHLTVHDELDFSVPKGREDLRREVLKIMRECVKLEVPLKIDCESGPSWGEAK